jgi:prepilin-type N-terminal cleavage/methylation domain-containing protein
MKRFKNSERGFTLMELMVVIVIVAILAAVAVPLYINYVKDAQRTEAKGAIGAIVTAEQAHYQKSAGSGLGATYVAVTVLEANGELDITEARAKWGFTTDRADASGFKITATLTGDPSITTTYDFTRAGGGSFNN